MSTTMVRHRAGFVCTWGSLGEVVGRDLACVEFLNQLLAITCRVMGRGLSWHEFPDIGRRA